MLMFEGENEFLGGEGLSALGDASVGWHSDFVHRIPGDHPLTDGVGEHGAERGLGSAHSRGRFDPKLFDEEGEDLGLPY